MIRILSIAILIIFITSTNAAGPSDTRTGDEMIDQYLAGRTREVGARFLDGAATRVEWEKKAPRLRREYLDMLGLWPLPERTPLQVTVTGTKEHAGAVIEMLHYQSRPGLYVTANLYRPKEARGRLPAILYVCGHSPRGRDGNKTAFQDHGLWFANNGYVCLVVDTLQLGEVAGIHHGTYREGRWWWQARGYTPAGVECWNGMRGIDYLISRPDVDAERVGVTGISGGGAATFWIAAADERVKVAVPVSGMSDLETYVSNKVINGHCDCMFLVNTYAWEWTTIAALIAPRPLLFANSDRDTIFPMDGNRRIIARLRQLYRLYDKPDLVGEHVSPGGHDYRPDLRIAIFQWLNRHLKNDASPVKDANFQLLPGKELRVLPEDKDLPKDSRNDRIDDAFVPLGLTALPEPGQFAAWQSDKRKELRERSFRAFPERAPAAQADGPATESVGGNTLKLLTEPGIHTHAMARGSLQQIQTLLVVTSGQEEKQDDLLRLLDRYGVGEKGVYHPRGVGATRWTTKSPPNYVARAHALLGQTVDEGRVWDIAAAARYLADRHKAPGPIRLVGRGPAGVLAAYAALFEPAIQEVVLIDPPASHRDGPIFLNVLRVLDIPDALGLLAPRVKLTLINARDKRFDRTAQLYKLAGAEGKLERK
jgi:dienelactone hydrolase